MLISTLLHIAFPIRVTPFSLPIGIVLTIASAALASWAKREMKRAGTNVRPDQPALTIVRDGPYRYTRNPMYVSLCCLQLGWGMILGGWVPVLFTILLAAILHFGVVLREEAYLESKFGNAYREFQRESPRWI
jgi:protein-S-isoprenylcysteine O-methyltransferase Ste14